MWSLLLSPGSWCAQGFVCALQESVSPVLCKFWQLYGGVNGDLLQEGLCHTQVCGTQSPCPCGRPLLTHTSTGDTQTLKGRSGSVSAGAPSTHKALFEPSNCLWQVWGLILNAVLPLLPFCWASSLPLEVGCLLKLTPVLCSLHSSPYCLAGTSPLSLGIGYLLTAAPAPTILMRFLF